jgi:NADH-quinone oxidoreductase subunit N
MSPYYTAADHFVLLPGLMLALGGCAVLLLDFIGEPDRRHRTWLLTFTLVALGLTAVALYQQQRFLTTGSQLTAFQGALVLDHLSLFFNWIFVVSAAIVAVISYRYLEVSHEPHGEYYGLLLLAASGMFFLAAGTELVILTVGLELMAVSFYILVGFQRDDRRSNEASLKYLLLGAFSSGFMLYGFSLLYGIAGSTKLSEIAAAVSARGALDPIVLLAIGTTAVGILFKVGAAPFHMWVPDAYEGSPTPVAGYLSVASKAASFAFMVRLFQGPFSDMRTVWEPFLIAIAVLSLTIGNLAAITQNNVKRLLAYSSIAHAGYILLGLIAGNDAGIQGMAVYILVYTFMTLGAFLVVAAMRREGVAGDDIDDLRGLIHRSPGYAVAMLIFLLSLAGIPPAAGFIGKYFIFVALIQSAHYALAALAALYVAVSLYYYFRIVRVMFAGEPQIGYRPDAGLSLRFALLVTAILTLGIGLYPEPFLHFARITDSAGHSLAGSLEAR